MSDGSSNPNITNMHLFCTKRFLFAIASISIFLNACSNDPETVKKVTLKNNSPNEIGKQVQTIYTVNGKRKMIMHSPVIYRYTEVDRPYTEMPEGIHIIFYDSLQNENGYMKSEYAIQHEDQEIIEARKNVEILNEVGEKLNTEFLIWDKNKRTISSNQFVKITTRDEILLGEGFESDDTFSRWRIKKPKGTLTLKN